MAYILLINLLMKTLGRFVLVKSETKKQMYLDWKLQHMNKTSNNQTQLNERMRYTDRKNIISELQPIDTSGNKLAHHHFTKTSTNSMKKNIRTSASTNKITPFVYANLQRERENLQINQFTISNPNLKRLPESLKKQNVRIRRSSSVGSKLNKFDNRVPLLPKNKLDQQKIKEKVIEAAKVSRKVKNSKVLCVMTMRRNGLRYKINHDFFTVSSQTVHQNFINQVKQALFPWFSDLCRKKVYLFHLGKEPISQISKQLNPQEYIIFADTSPKFDIPFDFQMKLFEQATLIEETVRKYEKLIQAQKYFFEEEENPVYSKSKKQQYLTDKKIKNEQYEWQRIKNVKNYADLVIQNPQIIKKSINMHAQEDELQKWCLQKYRQYQSDENLNKQQEKNPFFDIKTHFPEETSNEQILEKAMHLVNQQKLIKNTHQIKQRPISNMMERIRQEQQQSQKMKKQEQNRIKVIGYKSGKQFFRELDQKNIPLVQQNIPYMMAKYGITRAQAYNLYNLYKSLQKISAMRLYDSNQYRKVKAKGIDRQTFDEGLKDLQINPGEEVIRNICYFPDFIKWEQFIKIISISLRKTTQSKLEAILQGIGSSSQGCLTQKQIKIMIGSSLTKIFGKEEPELRDHFVNVVMKKMDSDNSGTIQCEELKNYVLDKGVEELDLISYLILNS